MTDLEGLREAYKVAAELSTDPNTQNGAVVFDWHGGILLRAANSLPVGVKDLPERKIRPLKYTYIEHAERNIIYVAAKEGIRTEDRTLYCCWAPCADCARAIIQAGFRVLVTHDLPEHKGQASWIETVRVGVEMLQEAGVKHRHVKGKIGDVKIKFAGKDIEP